MDHPQKPSHEEHPTGTFKSCLIGFGLSLLLTIASFLTVGARLFSPDVIYYTILGLALVQTFIQLVLFLHLGQESKPHWNTVTFVFMVAVLIILVLGSLWVMHHLNYNMMPKM